MKRWWWKVKFRIRYRFTRMWWGFLHRVLPWVVLRRVCSECDEFPMDPRNKTAWDRFFEANIPDPPPGQFPVHRNSD